MHTGSCLCGAVRYEIDGELAPIQLCHCSQCRRASGAGFAANIPVALANFRLLSGEASLKAYEGARGKQRLFCPECGAQVISRTTAAPGVVRVRAGLLAEPVEARPEFHFHVASKASWVTIADDLPQHPADRPK